MEILTTEVAPARAVFLMMRVPHLVPKRTAERRRKRGLDGTEKIELPKWPKAHGLEQWFERVCRIISGVLRCPSIALMGLAAHLQEAKIRQKHKEKQ